MRGLTLVARGGTFAMRQRGSISVVSRLLALLVREPGRVFTRDMLLARVWGDSAYRDPRGIDVHVRHLREKLESEPQNPELIRTVRGAGYRLQDI